MPKIALVTYEFNQGGTNRVLCALANGFVQSGYQPHIIACTSAGALDAELRSKLDPGVTSSSLSSAQWKSRSWGQLRASPAFRRWLKRERPDIVLATGNNISWFSGLNLWAVGKTSTRFFIKTTNPIVRELDGRLASWARAKVYGWLFRFADAVLTLSDSETRLLQSQFPKARDKFRTVFNAYLTAEFERVQPSISGSQAGSPLVMLGVGRLAEQKNFSRLLRAFAAANPQNAVLKIAGEGHQRPELEQLARSLGIADQVEFLGFVSDVPSLMASADLFVLSSDYEGLPAVVVEALACNCPVISTDCFANARDLLEGLPGCAVTERDAEALGGAIKAWAAAPVLRPNLRPHADLYSTRSSVESHIAAMEAA
jgi:glycosyltransferase involved in cell wall biosynthesis